MKYVFDNAAPQAPSRLAVLSDVFDPGTIRHLLATRNRRGLAVPRNRRRAGVDHDGCPRVWALRVTC